MQTRSPNSPRGVTRRSLITTAAGVTAAGWLHAWARPGAAQTGKPIISKNNIRQSIAYWCFHDAGEKWDLAKQAQIAKMLGCRSIELVDPVDFPILQQNGLICAITPNGMPGAPFVKGLNNVKYHDEVISRTKQAIDATSEAGFPNVIAFNGFKYRDAEDPKSGVIPLDEGADHCVMGLKKLASHAEKKKVTICIEMLNTRDTSHPMKGHPGYQGDHLDYVADIVSRVGSKRVKLLFDIYHVQIMDGDLIRRIKQYAELIGHVHTAGNPGRAELDSDQEINFPACMKALLESGYGGYVGHEFIPTRDPLEGLVQAALLCDV